ncbi:hypothetical protein [Pseudidiomarina salinarum]|uniref:hypothetical protein n=1 Tax=Pseudidiomarina salinarum TaxID=435908 RepID=UPI00068B8987|nr:hypothetical protein [Pseudidiomarina salinarum]RUO71325.1 RND transporter [Pseudidiomarina salinarum]
MMLFMYGNQKASWQSSLLGTLPDDTNPYHQAYQDSQQPNEQQLLLWFKISDQKADELQQHLLGEMLPKLANGSPAISPNRQLSLEPLLAFYRQNSGRYATNSDLNRLQTHPAEIVEAAQRRLQQPSPILTDIVRDPLLLSQNFIEQLPDLLPGFHYEAPLHLRNNDQRREFILVLSSGADMLSQSQSQEVVERIEEELKAVADAFPEVQIARSGLVFHASAAATQAKYEMALFGGLSIFFVVLMLIWVFRSIQQLLFTFATLCASSFVGLTALLITFDEPHVLTLVFATTLVGLCIDYVFHASIASSHGPKSWRNILPALWLGGLTTIFGYILLILLPLPLLQQLGVFMASALLTVLVLVVVMIPRMSKLKPPAPVWKKIHDCVEQGYRRLQHPLSPFVLVAIAFSAAGLTLYHYESNDSVRQLASSPPELLAQEQHLRQVTGVYFDADVLLITAPDQVQLLARYAEIAGLLPEWRQQGLLNRWQSLFDYVQPASQQQRALQAQRQLWNEPAGQAYLDWLGLDTVPQAGPLPAPETHPLFGMFVYALPVQVQPDGYLGVIRLAGVQQYEMWERELTKHPHVELFNPLQEASTALGKYRGKLEEWLLVLLMISWLVLILRLRPQCSWFQRALLSTQVIAVVVTALSLTLFIAMQTQALNVFHWVGAILVLVLGLDYGIFCASKAERGHVLQGISLSALTTATAFGALSFSSTPAIAAFGHVVLWGVLFSALLAPCISQPEIHRINNVGA